MNSKQLSHLPLRDLITRVEHASRELSEHLDQGVLPKVEKLEKAILEGNATPIADVAVHRQVQEILDTHQFTTSLFQKIESHLCAMKSSLEQDVFGGAS